MMKFAADFQKINIYFLISPYRNVRLGPVCTGSVHIFRIAVSASHVSKYVCVCVCVCVWRCRDCIALTVSGQGLSGELAWKM